MTHTQKVDLVILAGILLLFTGGLAKLAGVIGVCFAGLLFLTIGIIERNRSK